MPIPRRSRLLGLALLALPLPAFACGGWLHIELVQGGVYTLDRAAIVAQQPGLADCASDELVLTERGREVPVRIVGDAGGRFGPGARIEWIGQPLHGPESWNDPYSVNNVYLLGAAPGPHARIRDAEATGAGRAALERTLHIEQDNLMIRLDQNQQKPGEEPDVWQWAKLTQVDPQPFAATFDLPDLATRGPEVALTLDFRGLSEIYATPQQARQKPADHSVEITLNGRALAPLAWNGRDEVKRTITAPLALLKARGNTLALRVPKRTPPWDAANPLVDVVMFNWMEWRYPVAGDLDAGALPLAVRADASAPIELAYRGEGAPILWGEDGVRRPGRALGNGRYAFAAAPAGAVQYPVLDGRLAAPVSLRAVAGGDWRHPAHGYDYLIVAHPRLIDAIRPLAAFHARRGHQVAVIDVNQVYDQFNHGISHPQAIRNLVDYAWHHWPAPRPRFLLLVGSASFDIRHVKYNDLNYAKWTNAELLYPDHFGAVPGTPYAHQPARLADRNLIPTWQYPSEEGQSASDNAYGAVDGKDWHPVVAVGRFPVAAPAEVKAIVDKTIDYLTRPQLGTWRRDVMFITDESSEFKQASNEIAGTLDRKGFAAEKVYASASEANNLAHQAAIKAGLDSGQLLVHFIGHGGRYIWRTGPPDLRKNHDLFTLDDVAGLKNGARLPMVLSMTCYSAPFDNPTEDSIGERFLREPDKGAVAVFAASWRNSPSPAFSKNLIAELLEPGATIGEAIVRAKRKLQDRTLVEMYNLLGDPALVLERPRDAARLARDGDRWNPGVLVDLPEARFHGGVTVDWLDTEGNKLASADYRSDASRFRLPIPVTAHGKPAEVRVYAACAATGRDAVGALDLRAAPAHAHGRSRAFANWWRTLTAPPPKPRVRSADTISQFGFDGDDARAAAAARTPATAKGDR